MKKLALNLSVALLAVLFASSCSTMNTAEDNDYFGYSNSPKVEKKAESDNIDYSQAAGKDDYYDYNAGGAASANPVVVNRSFVYYDYYNPYRARPFVPWSNYYYDPYINDYVGVSVYYGSRYNGYYWRDWDYYYYHSYPYYYYNHRHHDWVYYNRYYNRSWNNHPVYVEPQRNKTTRSFGPSRGTYGNYDDVQLRSGRSPSRERSAVRGSNEPQSIRAGSATQRSPIRTTSTRSNSVREENSSTRVNTAPRTSTPRATSTRSTSTRRTQSARPSSGSSRSNSTSTRSSSRSSSRSSYSTPSSNRSSGRSSSSRKSGSSSSSRSKRR